MVGVVENVNVDPPLDVEGLIDMALLDDTVKSVTRPVVAPKAFET